MRWRAYMAQSLPVAIHGLKAPARKLDQVWGRGLLRHHAASIRKFRSNDPAVGYNRWPRLS
jgi:hypothetical protein